MPKEKINHASVFIQQLAEPACANGCDPSGLEACSDCPVIALPAAVEVAIDAIHWKPVPGGDGPGAWVPDGEPLSRDAEVSVGWLRDSWVQLSIEADPSYFQMAAKHPDGDDSARTSVYTPPLSRDEINKLIRVLRRARDQVFGRDE